MEISHSATLPHRDWQGATQESLRSKARQNSGSIRVAEKWRSHRSSPDFTPIRFDTSEFLPRRCSGELRQVGPTDDRRRRREFSGVHLRLVQIAEHTTGLAQRPTRELRSRRVRATLWRKCPRVFHLPGHIVAGIVLAKRGPQAHGKGQHQRSRRRRALSNAAKSQDGVPPRLTSSPARRLRQGSLRRVAADAARDRAELGLQLAERASGTVAAPDRTSHRWVHWGFLWMMSSMTGASPDKHSVERRVATAKWGELNEPLSTQVLLLRPAIAPSFASRVRVGIHSHLTLDASSVDIEGGTRTGLLELPEQAGARFHQLADRLE